MAVTQELREKAEELGVTVDSRWSDTTIQQKIDEKKADEKPKGKGNIVPGSDVRTTRGRRRKTQPALL